MCDDENRIISASNGYTASYVYDAFGHRVRSTVNGQTRDFLYDLNGKTIDQLTSGSLARSDAYAGGLVATYANGTTYFANSDWLGTFRVRSNVSGTGVETCTSLPFGEDFTCGATNYDVSPIHFTGKERDSESGNDHFPFRYYSETMGRFLTPDPAGMAAADPTNPQSWNRYAYVLNNPLSNIDPLGLDCIHIDPDTGNYEGFDSGDYCDNSTEELANSGVYVNGTVNTIYTTTGNDQGVVTGYSATSDSGTLIAGTFATAQNQQLDTSTATTADFIPSLSSQAAMVAIANTLNNNFPTACTYSLSARVSVLGLGVGANSTQSGSSISYGVTSTLSNSLRVTIGMSTNGLGAPDPGSSIRIGPPAGGLALNPTSGQIGAYAGKSFNIFGMETGATLTATVGKIGTNNSCPSAGH